MQINPYFGNHAFRELFTDIPDHDRFIDLNVGNGEILFTLCPEKSCFVNDTNTALIEFYQELSNPEFLFELEKIANAWDLLKEFSHYSADEIFITFQDLLKDIITVEDSEYIIRAIILMNIDDDKFSKLFNRSFLINLDLFTSSIINSVVNEFKVVKGAFVSLDIDTLQINEEFRKSIEMAFKFGFFNHFQNILNLQNTNFISVLNKNKQRALWYFLSQNSKGKFKFVEKESHKNKFNAEYHPTVTFSERITYFKSDAFKTFKKRINFSNKNLGEFIDYLNPSSSDFICGDFRGSGYFAESTRDVFLKNELVKTIEFLKNSQSKWILLFSSQRFVEILETYVSIDTQTIEIQEKPIIITNNF